MTLRNVSRWTLLLAAAMLQAQPLPKFEAASVKPAGPYVPGSIPAVKGLVSPGTDDPGQIAWRRTHPRVVDKTGLTGEFEFRLEFASNLIHPGEEAASEPSGGPTIFTALQKQLGLKLVKAKNVTEDVLVIDHIDKVPTAN